MDDVSKLAAAYLQELLGQGHVRVPVTHEHARLKPTTVYGEDIRDYIQKLDKEFKNRQRAEKEGSMAERYDISDVPDKFVLKHKNKFFYGFKHSEVKWTHDIRLALPVTEIEAEALSLWLEEFGSPVTKFPAPKKEE